ncbi:hypothetical protein PSECIP111854_01080 [Pseudoalteromonas sp. CIP111854]|uniref:DUF4249 family protein n=1 Tax=Pseudoalteromonas holothuriae TaxID=2963714 RepID=A0A9W4VN80_9GAMM|nr:hypothetical protein [Pseudoalteromonas sp. CIP111854]CAH9052982.1 hypothetical protein PSECIP111854_01080 [Pseudoalteromonas sp. CIP111854]
MSHFKLGTIALCSLLVSACSSDTNSNLVKTEAIWSDILVKSDGDISKVVAELNVSSRNGNNINLVQGDKLSVTATNNAISANMTKNMDKDNKIFDIDYRANFPYYQADTQYEIRLYRAKDKVTLSSKVTLPEPILILAPQAYQTFSADSALELRWAKATKIIGDQSLKINVDSTCKHGEKEITKSYNYNDIKDDGIQVVDFETIGLFKNEELNSNFTCTVKFSFERRRYGSVDGRYASSSRTYATQTKILENINITIK